MIGKISNKLERVGLAEVHECKYQFIHRSGDSTARIWTIPPGPCGDSDSVPPPIVLKHNPSSSEKSKDVTTLDWNVCALNCLLPLLIGLGRWYLASYWLV